MHEPIDFDARPARPEVEKVHLFTLDETDYFIPAEIRPSVGLKYLFVLKTQGEQAAIADLLYSVLGGPAMEALANSDAMEAEDLKVITEIIRDRAMGAMERGNDS
jgi:hypothetical protein